jgi:hypothetical protein
LPAVRCWAHTANSHPNAATRRSRTRPPLASMYTQRNTVDFWDLTKLLFRRWYVAAPIFLATLCAAVWVVATVPPDYQATTYVQILPPTIRPDDLPKGSSHNPWADLGQEALGQAAIVIVSQPDRAKQLVAAGFSDNYTLSMDDRSPMIIIEATGKSKDQAIGTARQLAAAVGQEIGNQQSLYGLPQNQLISTRTLGNGETLTAVTSALKRTLIVVTAIGLILTAATTIGVDAYLRRRLRRQQGQQDPVWPGEPQLPPHRTPMPRPSMGRSGLGGSGPTNSAPGNPRRLPEPIITNVALPVGNGSVRRNTPTERSPESVTVTYTSTASESVSTTDTSAAMIEEATASFTPVAEDTTIILPLANPLRSGPER